MSGRPRRDHCRRGESRGRSSEEVEIWQIGALDCNEDGDAARGKVGAMLAFLAGYVIGDKQILKAAASRNRCANRCSNCGGDTAHGPADADIKLVQELGLFDYLSRRLAICGTPAECLAQARAARRQASSG